MSTRRRFLGGLAASLVIGFDPLSRRWIRAADAASRASSSLAPLPSLSGTIHFDPHTRAADSSDQGNIARQIPAAVLRPGSIEDIAAIIRFCRRHDIKVAARGQHQTMHGQGLTCGLVIENRSLSKIHSIAPSGADVDAGVLWHELTEAAFARGLRPASMAGFTNLSIGGVLSAGGCPLGNHQGGVVDRVRALTVVTGEGEVVDCSETQQSELFEAALAGLGQCAVIARATVELVPARPMARTHLLHYSEPVSFFRDFRALVRRGELDEIYTLCFPPGRESFLYQINATIFYDPASPPDTKYLLRELSLPPAAAVPLDLGYLNYAFFLDRQIDALRRLGWDQLVKPWFDVWIPDAHVETYVPEIIAGLTPEDVGPTGFLLLFAQRRAKMKRPFYRLPSADNEYVWLFDVATASALPGPNPSFASRMIARNRVWYDRLRALGGTRYPIGALDFKREDWIAQYGERWTDLAERRRRFDPDNILTPGAGIF